MKRAVFGALRNVFNLIMHRFDTVYSVCRKIIFLSGITGKKTSRRTSPSGAPEAFRIIT